MNEYSLCGMKSANYESCHAKMSPEDIIHEIWFFQSGNDNFSRFHSLRGPAHDNFLDDNHKVVLVTTVLTTR